MANPPNIPTKRSILDVFATCGPTSTWSDDRIRTAKCETCGLRVELWSKKCSRCNRRICSKCLDKASERTYAQKAFALDHVENGCWCQRFRSNMNSQLAHLKGVTAPGRVENGRVSAQMANFRWNAGTAAGNSDPPDSVKRPPESQTTPEPGHQYSQRSKSIEISPKTRTRPNKRKQPLGNNPYGDVFLDTSRDSGHGKLTNHGIELPISFKLPRVVGGTRCYKKSDGATTVIVGAGIVGMFIAHELAACCRLSNVKHHIIVVETRDIYCELASGHCGGLLVSEKTSAQFEFYNFLATQRWQEILSSEEVRTEIGFDKTSAFDVMGRTNTTVSGDGGASIIKSNETLVPITTCLGRMRCRDSGVRFAFHHTISKVTFEKHSEMFGVTLQDINSTGSRPRNVECRNVILSAGIRTPELYGDICGVQGGHFKNNVQHMHWITVPINGSKQPNAPAIRIHDATIDGLRPKNDVTMVPLPAKGSVQIWCIQGVVDNRNEVSSNREEMSETKREGLRRMATLYYNVTNFSTEDESAVIDQGSVAVSCTTGNVPLLGRLPLSLTSESDEREGCGNKGRLWVCHGFGASGTTLAPGVALLLASILLYESATELRVWPQD